MKAAKSVDLKGSTRLPSVDVPSGKTQSTWPEERRAFKRSRCAAASAGFLTTKIVPVARASQPMPGHPATSAFATK